MAACILYYIAVQSSFDERHTWVGAAASLMEDKSTVERWAKAGGCWSSCQGATAQLAVMAPDGGAACLAC